MNTPTQNIIETAAGYVDVKSIPEQRLTNFTVLGIVERGKDANAVHMIHAKHTSGREQDLLMDLNNQNVIRFNIGLLTNGGGHFVYNGNHEQLQRLISYLREQFLMMRQKV